MARFNPCPDPSREAFQHGMAITIDYKKVQCCYCGEIVPGFFRLQHHLAGIDENKSKCSDVPEKVKEYFKTSLLVSKESPLVKEVSDLNIAGSSSKRQCTSIGGSQSNLVLLAESAAQSAGSVESDTDLISARPAQPVSNGRPPQPVNNGRLTQPVSNGRSTGQRAVDFSDSNVGKICIGQSSGPRATSAVVERCNGQSTRLGTIDISALNASKRSVGRFFLENAIDVSTVISPSFKNLIGALRKRGETNYSLPTLDELNGWIFNDELKDIMEYVNQIRPTWERTGCSILLDGWTDQSGRDLIIVVVDCPAGPTYLRSGDVSPSKGDDALLLFLESVIEQVGIKNVVQIVAHTSSDTLNAAREKLTHKYRSLFWVVSGTRCLSMILEKFAAESDLMKPTLEKAGIITRSIYCNSEALELLKKHIDIRDLVIPSKIKAATPFLTLENFICEQTNLENMCTSSEWLGSHWGSSQEGKRVARLINDESFWRDVGTVVKVSIPVVTAISLINGEGEPYLGFIYETMDQIKETILEELGEENSTYIKYWKLIDEIWNGILHSPLHASAYFLNPKFYYSDGFQLDPEVASGLLTTVVSIVGDCNGQDKVSQQIGLYKDHIGAFQLGMICKDSLSPAAWWAYYGCDCPELQSIAIRLHSQKCNGAESYELRKDVTEKILSGKRKNWLMEQKEFKFTYLHYNLKLKQFEHGPKFNIRSDEIDPTDDWIVGDVPTDETNDVAPVKPENGSKQNQAPETSRKKDLPVPKREA